VRVIQKSTSLKYEPASELLRISVKWLFLNPLTISPHPAGHDSGMIVFKLERERPAFTLNEGGTSAAQLLYIKDRYVRMYRS